LIRHTFLRDQAAPAKRPLTVSMIESSLGGLLMAAVGLAELQAAGFFPATGTAITLAAITTAAEIKHCAAGRKMTYALAKNGRTGNRHGLSQTSTGRPMPIMGG
jgi:hypothetical protein